MEIRKVETVLFGEIEIPKRQEDIVEELASCEELFMSRNNPPKMLQNRIDYLEYALNDSWGEEDV